MIDSREKRKLFVEVEFRSSHVIENHNKVKSAKSLCTKVFLLMVGKVCI